MTNTEVPPAGAFVDAPIVDAIYRLGNEMVGVATNAHLCANNHSYYGYRGMTAEIPLLDCDVLLSASRGASNWAHVPSADDRTRLAEIERSMNAAFGPYSFEHVLNDLDSYCIPDGAYYELLRQREAVSNSASWRGRRLLGQFESALQSDSPANLIRRSRVGKKLKECILEELTELIELGAESRELRLLEAAVSRATPVEAFLGKEPKESGSAFDACESLLTARRESLTKSNRSDALNFSQLIWFFVSPSYRSRSVAPILVTETEALDLVQERMDIPGPDQVRLVHRQLYVPISLGLRKRCDQKPAFVANAAAALARDATRISGLARKAIPHLRAHNHKQSGTHLYRELCERFSSLWEHWGDVLSPVSSNSRIDRTTLYNTVVGHPEVVEALKGLEHDDSAAAVRQSIQRLRYRIREALRDDRVLFQLVVQTQTPFMPGEGEGERILSVFSITAQIETTHDRTMLTNARPGVPLADMSWDQLKERQVTRTYVALKAIPSKGAVLVVDFVRISQKDTRICVTCAHQSDVDQVSEAVCGMFMSSTRGEAGAVGTIHRAGESTCAHVDLEPTVASATAFQKAIRGSDYLELAWGATVVFADIEPNFGSELQVGISAPEPLWNRSLVNSVSQMIGNLTCHGLREEECRWLVDHVIANFPRKPR